MEAEFLQKQILQASKQVGDCLQSQKVISCQGDSTLQPKNQCKEACQPITSTLTKQQPTYSASQNSPSKAPSAYKYASIIVAKACYHQQILTTLHDHYNIDGFITAPFKDQKLKGAIFSAILYHDIDLLELVSVVVSNPLFIFEGKSVLLLRITEWLKLDTQTNINSQQLGSLDKWLKKKYPEERVELWRLGIQDGVDENYIKTGSLESALYIYLVLGQFLMRCRLDNGRVEKLTAVEKERFLKVYPEV